MRVRGGSARPKKDARARRTRFLSSENVRTFVRTCERWESVPVRSFLPVMAEDHIALSIMNVSQSVI